VLASGDFPTHPQKMIKGLIKDDGTDDGSIISLNWAIVHFPVIRTGPMMGRLIILFTVIIIVTNLLHSTRNNLGMFCHFDKGKEGETISSCTVCQKAMQVC